jgi:hypothetical protein
MGEWAMTDMTDFRRMELAAQILTGLLAKYPHDQCRPELVNLAFEYADMLLAVAKATPSHRNGDSEARP